MSESKNVLVVDDHPIVRAGICRLLRKCEGFVLCGEAADVPTAESLTERLQPDLTVLDLVLGGRDGLELIRTLKLLNPAGKMLVYSSHDEKIYARRALEAGAHGYLTKRIDIKELREALKAVAAGKCYVSEIIQQSYLGQLVDSKRGRTGAGQTELSARELQILHLLGLSMSSAQIARDLHLSMKTIGTFRERLKDKLNLSSARELESYAIDFARTSADAHPHAA